MSDPAPARRIVVEWDDGTVGHFERQADGSWHQATGGLRITGYDAPNVLRVLSVAVGAAEPAGAAEVTRPPARVVEALTAALEAERRSYVLTGGGRSFGHEDVQDEAMRFVRSLGTLAPNESQEQPG